MYYSPKAQKALHKIKPEKYDEEPDWANSEQLEYIEVSGLSATDDFRFYKYSKKTAELYEKIAKKHLKKKLKGK